MIIKGDFHIHSYASDGEASPEEIVRFAKRKGFLTVSVTDHNTFVGSVLASKTAFRNVVVVPGAEVRTSWGDILILCDAPVGISEDPWELRDIANDNNCLLIPAHPFDILRLGIGKKVYQHRMWDLVECFNGGSDPITNVYTFLALRKYPLPKLANSDAHVLEMIGSAFNYIDVDSLSKESILEALRNGATAPFPLYSIRGLKDRFVWAIKRKLNIKRNTWLGNELTHSLGFPWR